MKIFDKDGLERDADWLRQEFGAVEVQRGDGDWHVAELREAEGAATIIVTVLDQGSEPVEGALVARWWPDPSLPELPIELTGWHAIGVYGETNANGDIGFGMGGGDYYYPPDAGASDVWIDYDSDLVHGLGMVGSTNHRHLNVVFRYLPEPPPEPTPEPTPSPEPPPDHNPLDGVVVYGLDGSEMTALDAHRLFGLQDVHRPEAESAYRLKALSASEMPYLAVMVLDDYGSPVEDVTVVLGTRSVMPPKRWEAATDSCGVAQFNIADDAIYNAEYSAVDQQGPLAVAVKGADSDVYNSVGLVTATPRRHLDPTFVWKQGQEPEPPTDFESAVLERMDRIIALLESV